MSVAKKILKDAEINGYSVGFFEAWNLESLEAIIDAAEEMNSPVIVGFNGGIITSEQRIIKPQNLEYISAICKVAKNKAKVPVATILNENTKLDTAIEGIKLGFDIIMYEYVDGDYDEYIHNMRRLVEIARAFDIVVEGSIGDLVWPEDGRNYSDEDVNRSLTDVQKAIQFIDQTNIDVLSISIGNVNVLLNGKAKINYEHFFKLRKALDVMFVLHGGSGVDDSDIQKLSKLGIVKINYGAILNEVFFNDMQKALQNNKEYVSPKFLLGSGYDVDILAHGRIALKELVKQKMVSCGSVGKAWCL